MDTPVQTKEKTLALIEEHQDRIKALGVKKIGLFGSFVREEQLEYLQHILDETAYLVDRAEGLNKKEFIQDETLKRAFVRSLEIIGEATKNVSADLRQKYGHIDWRAMAGMRDRLIHRYFGIDYDIVWDVVINKVPLLQQGVQQIIQNESNS